VALLLVQPAIKGQKQFMNGTSTTRLCDSTFSAQLLAREAFKPQAFHNDGNAAQMHFIRAAQFAGVTIIPR
jgi:hypothetical protein